MSRRHQARRRRSYGRRQHEMRERRSDRGLPFDVHVDHEDVAWPLGDMSSLSRDDDGTARPRSA